MDTATRKTKPQINYGRYRNRDLKEIAKKDPGFIVWFDKHNPGICDQELLDYCKSEVGYIEDPLCIIELSEN
jgi:hypothetical protein